MRTLRLLFVLPFSLIALLTACQQRPERTLLPPPANTTTPAPLSPTMTVLPPHSATATPLPLLPSPPTAPTQSPHTARPTPPWTQGGPWPLPESPLSLNIQTPAQVSEALWRAAIAAGTGASEIWLGQQAGVWQGPNFPPQAHVLFTDRRPSPSGYLIDVYFTIAPTDLPALQQAFDKAGWRPLHNINPALAQMSPGLVLLEFHHGGQADEKPLNLFLLWAGNEKTLWARATLGPLSAAPPRTQPPPLPWRLTLPNGWQAKGLLTSESTAGERLQASAWQVAVPAAGAQAGQAMNQWEAELQAQDWQLLANGGEGTLAWASWAKGERRRTLVLLPEPWQQTEAVVLAYTLTVGSPPSSTPQWHGSLPSAEGRQAALLALLFTDPQFASPLTLTLGVPPAGTWPLAQQAALTFGRHSENGTLAWFAFGDSAEATFQALQQQGWAWRSLDARTAAPALFGAPWPEIGMGQKPVLSGALCKGDASYLAQLHPSGTLALVAAPVFCTAAQTSPMAKLVGLVPPPAGYPFRAYGALEGSYVGLGENAGHALSLAAFWLPVSPTEGTDWLQKTADAFQNHQWTVKQPASAVLLAHPASGNPQTLLFALPALDGQTLFGIIANR